MRTTRLESAARREQIARATLGLIAEGGLKAVRIGAIARRVGVAPSAIYRHFAGKEELLDAVVELVRARLDANLRKARESRGGAVEILAELLALQVGQIRENQAIPRMIFSDDFYLGRSERKAEVHQMIGGFIAGVGETIRAGQEDGEIRPELDSQVTAVLFIGLFMPPAILWVLSEGRFDVTQQTREAWRIFRRSIETGSAVETAGRRSRARPARPNRPAR